MEQATGAIDQARGRQRAASRNQAAMRAMATDDLSGAEVALACGAALADAPPDTVLAAHV